MCKKEEEKNCHARGKKKVLKIAMAIFGDCELW